MANKNTYMYKVSMGNGDRIKEVAFCYARNARAARNGYKALFRDKKYDRFEVLMFGEADIKEYPDLFRPMPKEEADYIIRAALADAEAYAQRKPDPESENK